MRPGPADNDVTSVASLKFDYCDRTATVIRFAFRGIEIAAKIPYRERVTLAEAEAIREMLCGDPRPSVRAEHDPRCEGCEVCGHG